MTSFAHFLDKYFRISEKGSSIGTEVLAGLVSFVATCYLIFVVPSMLADTGMPKDAVTVSTILITALSTIFIGLYANYPVIVAPGLGITAFFAYYVCGSLGLPWQVGLGAVFISGLVFLFLTVTKLREMIVNAIPIDLKYATVVGVGTFLAFIGMKNMGLIVADASTFVTLGNIQSLPVLLGFFGICLIGILVSFNFTSAIIVGMFVVSALGMLLGVTPPPTTLSDIMSFTVPSIAPIFLQMDIMGAVNIGIVTIILTLTVVDLFDSLGVLVGVASKTNLLKEDGTIIGVDKALFADSVATIASATFGTTTATSYLESVSGTLVGGRTGLVAVVAGLLFFCSLFFVPITGLIPAYATSPVLIVVGAMMMQEIVHIHFSDFTIALPTFIIIMGMPLTFSIATGLGLGIITFVLMRLFTGRVRSMSKVLIVIACIFLASFLMK